MTKILSLDKKEFIDWFLSPVNRITEECSIMVTGDSVSALVNDPGGTIILYCKIKTQTPAVGDQVVSLNIKNVRKFAKVIDCIKTNPIDLIIDDNASVLEYKSPDMSFKLHLVTDAVIRKSTISLEKIAKLSFNSEFILPVAKVDEVIKGSNFSDTEKIYFYSKDGSIFADVTDKAQHDTDSITYMITNTCMGDAIETPLPFNLEILRIVSALKADTVTVKINNTYKILLFEVADGQHTMKYVVPAYTK